MAERGVGLLEYGLRDIYDAEHRFADALETMIEQVSDQSLSDGFRRHLRVTREHVRRLDRAFDEMGREPSREPCPGAKGLVDEYERFVQKEKPDTRTLDVFAADSCLKAEHYEIASYRAMINLAQFLNLGECVKAFRQNLAEEEQAAAELQSNGARLAADLTGAGSPGVVRAAAGTLVDHMREGAFVTAGTARAVGEQATRGVGKAIRSAERRGRASRTGRSKATTSRTKTARSTRTRPRTAVAQKRTSRTARKTTANRATARRKTGTRTRARSAQELGARNFTRRVWIVTRLFAFRMQGVCTSTYFAPRRADMLLPGCGCTPVEVPGEQKCRH